MSKGKLDRRFILRFAATSILGASSVSRGQPSDTGTPSRATTFVLVHGAWHGGWCWRYVVARLREHGHRVYSPTLTGLGDRVHLLQPTTGLSTHIEDIVSTLEVEELNDVVLVGHSYSGMVLGGVADRVRSRLRRLVFLDSLVPVSNQSLAEAANLSITELRGQSQDGVTLPVPPVSYFNVDHATWQGRWLERRLTPQPIAAFLDRVEFRNGGITGVASTYIRCTQTALATSHYALLARNLGWSVRTLDTGHDAMITAPGQVAALLEEEAVARV
jgi:pimeloyl-ACP methyl ester carboxylesterase